MPACSVRLAGIMVRLGVKDLLPLGRSAGDNRIGRSLRVLRLSLELWDRGHLVSGLGVGPVRSLHALLCHTNHLADSVRQWRRFMNEEERTGGMEMIFPVLTREYLVWHTR